MKLIAILLVPSLALAAAAQSPAPAKPHPAATHAAAPAAASAPKAACSALPPLSPKIPAPPPGTPCAKPLYTLTLVSPVKIEYVSPLEGTALEDVLNVPTATTFSLSYVDTKVGTGELAAAHKWYSIRYHGYLIDGTEFDSSDKHGTEPFAFSIDQHQVVPGWLTGFAGVRVGGKRRLFIPPQLAYGNKGSGAVPPNSMLVFDVEFVSQSNTDPTPKPAPPATSAAPNPATPPAAQSTPAQPATPPPAAAPAPSPAPPATPPAATAPRPQ